ncbi:FAST kinase domain-containing protein 5, mitochondrial-like [Musca vetustissima]|uniref:FAST kinase domain-containing protein 5, mitochondrial-like n=1 Tax=Musca vetustissima TaxID=27455 RepID=UPI002AB6C578|nr:FAST kinase domain-containing protein 5, mitochondrial-like [Musca vetustissima]
MYPRQLFRSILTNNLHFYQCYQSTTTKLWKPLTTTRYLHLVPSNFAKIYMDRENLHAHQVLEESLKPYQIFATDVRLHPDSKSIELQEIVKCLPENASTSEVFAQFQRVCEYCHNTNSLISNNAFTAFVQQFCDRIHLLSDEELRGSLKALTLLPQEENVRVQNFVELWNILDIECCRRIEKWSTDELLLVCDAWYSLNLARICEYVWEALRKLGRKVIKMQPSQLVQTMFFCNIMRRTVFDMFDFEVNLAKCAKDMTLGELGVMSMGFFKTQTPIRNPELINYIYERLMQELDTVDEITFVAILKALRYSSKLPQVDIMMKLLDKISAEKFDDMNLLTSLHVALLGCELQCCHEEIVEKILNKFHNEMSNTRLKDLERISLAVALFNIKTPNKIEDLLCQKILESLKGRIDEIMKHPKCFTNCLHYLTLRGFYDKEMLSVALDRRFLKHAVGSSLAISREIFNLDTFVKVNLANDNYEGNQLADKYRKTMGKMLTHYIPDNNPKYKLNATDRILLQMKEITAGFLPHCQLKHILPNYERADVVICYDRVKRKSLPLSPTCPEDYNGIILTREQLLGDKLHEDIETVAFIIAGWNNVIRGKNRHTGLFDMKLKQLELLGHKSVVIYWHEWRELETRQDRINFVKRRLSSVINL